MKQQVAALKSNYFPVNISTHDDERFLRSQWHEKVTYKNIKVHICICLCLYM